MFLTTHYMDEAEYCDRMAVIDHGKIIAMGSPSELKEQTGQKTFNDVFLHLTGKDIRDEEGSGRPNPKMAPVRRGLT